MPGLRRGDGSAADHSLRVGGRSIDVGGKRAREWDR